jgi:hypothetical protein
MRVRSTIAAAAMLTATAPAFAATIVQNLPAVQTMGDFTPFDINGNPFNPALGTLTDVSATLMGSYTPDFFVDLCPPCANPGIISTTYFVITPEGDAANQFSGTAPGSPQSVVPVFSNSNTTAEYIGAPTSVDLTFDFPVVSDFISALPGPLLLAEFGFNSSVTHTDGASDLTSFSGTFALTYTYGPSLPEPSSLVLLSFGAGLVLLLTRRHIA